MSGGAGSGAVPGNGGVPGGGGGLGAGSSVGAGSTQSGAGALIGTGTHRPGPNDRDGGCQEIGSKGELLPLDIFIMFDQSQSMSCAIPAGGDRWAAVKAAITGFVNDPGAKGIGVGLQYFGLPAPGGLFPTPLNSSCNAADYAGADVPIAPLPGNAGPIADSLNRHSPTTNTPSEPALEAAIGTARSWKQKNPSHTVITLFITDGQPNACGTGDGGSFIDPVVSVARAGIATPEKMQTYVIGITSGGTGCFSDPAPPNKADLDRVAAAGGTKEALMIDLDATASQKFLAAMNTIRVGAQAKCEYSLPMPGPGVKLDPSLVNVTVSNSLGGAGSVIYRVTGDTTCDPSKGGWHYDNEATPTKILLCPASCTAVAQAGTVVDLKFGCQSSQRPPA
jgi:hypothetical protein